MSNSVRIVSAQQQHTCSPAFRCSGLRLKQTSRLLQRLQMQLETHTVHKTVTKVSSCEMVALDG